MLTGNFKNVNNWLKENIHKYGSSIKNLELIEKCCNEKFNPKYYIEYLIKKFSNIYEL